MSRRPNIDVTLLSSWTNTSSTNVVTTGNPWGKKTTEVTVSVDRRKPKGWVPPTPYSYSRRSYVLPNDALYDVYYGNSASTRVRSFHVTGNVFGFDTGNGPIYGLGQTYVPQGVPSSMRDKAIVKARLSMKDQDVNLGVAFAERNRTAMQLGDTAMSLARAFTALKKGDIAAAKRALGVKDRKGARGGSLTKKWLELQYAWKPLLSDVYGATEALAKRQNSDWKITGKGSSREAIKGENRINPSRTTAIQRGNGKVKGTRGVFVRIDALPQNDLLLALRSLGVTNPLEIAWEFVPYSFVVDWCLPIGDYLSSLDAMLGYGPTWCSISTLEKYSNKFTLESTPPFSTTPWPYNEVTRRGVAFERYVSLSREVSTSVPLPSLPRFQDPVSLGHMANGLSLLTQAFSR